jgi:hypothetical protein
MPVGEYTGPPLTPWTPEQIAAWDAEHATLKVGEAIAFEARLEAGRARIKELRGKGAQRMTPAEKDELLMLIAERLGF